MNQSAQVAGPVVVRFGITRRQFEGAVEAGLCFGGALQTIEQVAQVVVHVRLARVKHPKKPRSRHDLRATYPAATEPSLAASPVSVVQAVEPATAVKSPTTKTETEMRRPAIERMSDLD